MYLVTSLAELLIKLLLPCVINYSSLEELWWKKYIYLIDLIILALHMVQYFIRIMLKHIQSFVK